ncbi:MAG TPA: hypothetical protein VLT36_11650 [Candidatus Dormibacteraeota bacterium]|nr:hypothetical protein [Candidatus Dormibacteraeota bacterium]
MKNSELDEILRTAPPPKQPTEYWDEFSGRVLRNAALGRHAREVVDFHGRARRFPKLALGFGVAAAVVVVLFSVVRLDNSRSTSIMERPATQNEFDGAKKYYEEIVTLFPGRLAAIIFDKRGEHLLLKDTSTAAGSLPVYLKICGRSGCEQVVTFSGQQIPINGELCDVLVGHSGEIIVTGPTFWWSSGTGARPGERYRIEARPLQTTG